MKTPFTAKIYRLVMSAALAGAALSLISCSSQAQVPVQPETPAKHEIHANDLPAPYATRAARNFPQVQERPEGAALHVPPGFTISEWARDLNNPRFLTIAPNGDIFVAESAANRVSILRPSANGSRVETKSVFAGGLRQPFGIAFYPVGPDPKYVYIADTDEVMRFPYKNGDLKATGPAQDLIPLTPGGYNQHWTRAVTFSPDSKKLYVSVGSRENVGIEDPPRACVMQYNPDGTEGRVYASGLRNAVDIAFSPKTGALWAAVNERDELGDEIPPDYATTVKDGGFYGWPYYYTSGSHHDPRMPDRPDLAAKTIVPDCLLEAHCAALSITFGYDSRFPAAYKNSIYVALHGSWNRSTRSGYKIVRVLLKPDGTATGAYEDFVWGWATPDGSVWGRPVCAVVAKDGSLLITDDGGNNIWRVTYK